MAVAKVGVNRVKGLGMFSVWVKEPGSQTAPILLWGSLETVLDQEKLTLAICLMPWAVSGACLGRQEKLAYCDFQGPWAFGLCGLLLSFKNDIKNFDNFTGVKTSIIYAGSIVIYSLLLYSFFLLILREIKMKTFVWAPESVVGSRCCTYYPHWISQPCLTDEMRERLTSQKPTSVVWCCHQETESWKDVSTSLRYPLKVKQSRHKLRFLCQKVHSLPYTFPLP